MVRKVVVVEEAFRCEEVRAGSDDREEKQGASVGLETTIHLHSDAVVGLATFLEGRREIGHRVFFEAAHV